MAYKTQRLMLVQHSVGQGGCWIGAAFQLIGAPLLNQPAPGMSLRHLIDEAWRCRSATSVIVDVYMYVDASTLPTGHRSLRIRAAYCFS